MKKSPLSPIPKITLVEEAILHNQQCWHWMLHVTKINRRNVLVAMDTDSRFCMAFWGLIKGNVEKFLEQLHHRLALHIIGLINMGGLDEALFEKSMSTFSKNHHEYAFVQRGDRSVQAHINDVFMSLQYEQYRWEDDIPREEELIISDLRHNDTLRKRRQDKDYLLPNQELSRNWLDSYGNVHQQDIKHAINKYQQKIHQLWGGPFDIDVDALNLDELVGEDELSTTQAPSTSNNVIPFKPR